MHLLEVRGLVKIYGRRRVVDGVAFHVNAGEVVGLLGPNGAGKTTSFRMATGQITPNAGQVWFNGEDVTHLPMYRRARLGMGYLSQETSVFRRLTVEQNLLGILEIMPTMRTLGRRLTKKERTDRTDQVLEQFGLTRLRKNNAARLSGGEKRRLEIARCLICEPLLILLDEPFTGIDPKTIADIQDIVRDLRAQGIGVLLTDHNVREALKITTRSYLIKDGKVRTHGTPQEIINDPIAIDEYLGKSFSEPALPGGSYMPYQPMEYGPPPAPSTPLPSAENEPSTSEQPADPEPVLHSVLEQEKIHRLVEGLKSPDQAMASAELTRRGTAALSALLAALERRDVEMRRQAVQVMQAILKRPIPFDPYAPEVLRKQQLAALREQYERKAG
jgi:lipopolysaccharide export system ATP-binding protein